MEFNRWVFVRSSLVTKAGYNEEEGVMYVVIDGKTLYYKAPETIYRGLISSKSPGEFYRSEIKNKQKRVEL